MKQLLLVFFFFFRQTTAFTLPDSCQNGSPSCCDDLQNTYDTSVCKEDANGNTIAINLSSQSLTGSIPSFNSLTELLDLNLEHNAIQGEVSSDTIHNLVKMTSLKLGSNKFSGTFPTDIQFCTSLQYLDVSLNGFGGAPASIEKLTSLSTLNMQENGFENSNSFVKSLYKTQLTRFNVSNNEISGVVDNMMENVTTLVTLDMSHNTITSFPLNGTFTHMTHLDLSNNGLDQKLSDTWETMAGLLHLDLSHNSLDGKMPPSFRVFTSMTHMDCSFNHLSDELHPDFERWEAIKHMDVSDNYNMGGLLDKGFAAWTDIEFLDIENNYFDYYIPEEWSTMTKLTELKLGGNKLKGPIPSWVTKCSNMNTLRLQDNDITGTVPHSLTSLSQLQYFDSSHNDHTGNLPDLSSIGLDTLYLAGNEPLSCPVTDYSSWATTTDWGDDAYGSSGQDNCGTAEPSNNDGNNSDEHLGGGYIFLIVMSVLIITGGFVYMLWKYVGTNDGYEFEYKGGQQQEL